MIVPPLDGDYGHPDCPVSVIDLYHVGDRIAVVHDHGTLVPVTDDGRLGGVVVLRDLYAGELKAEVGNHLGFYNGKKKEKEQHFSHGVFVCLVIIYFVEKFFFSSRKYTFSW